VKENPVKCHYTNNGCRKLKTSFGASGIPSLGSYSAASAHLKMPAITTHHVLHVETSITVAGSIMIK